MVHKESEKDRYKRLNEKLCVEWRDSQKNKSPLTNRRIQKGKRVYNKINKVCDKIFESEVNVNGFTLYKKESFGDGSCFFHSVIQLIDPLNNNNEELGLRLREDLAEKFTLKDYIDSMDKMFAKTRLTEVYPDLNINYPDLNILQIIRRIPDKELRTDLRAAVNEQFEEYKEVFFDTREYADVPMFNYIARKLRLNIFFYQTNIPNRFVSGSTISQHRKSIFLYNIDNHHFEPLFGINGERKFSWASISDVVSD